MNDNYDKRNCGGTPKALPSREDRIVFRLASTGKYSSMEIIKQTILNVCRKTICNVIRRAGNLQYATKLIKSPLSSLNKINFYHSLERQ